MKPHQYYLFVIFFIYSTVIYAQQGVGIGTSRPDPSAVLHVHAEAGNKGILFPQLTNGQANNISNPANGLVVFDTDRRALIYNDSLGAASGKKWVEIIPQGLISMWSGTNIPNGWALCNGNWYNPLDNTDQSTISSSTHTIKTPDLRGRFIVASGQNPNPKAEETDNPSYTLHSTGGLNEVTLSSAQSGLPSHAHVMTHGHGARDLGHFHEIDNHGHEDVGDANKQASYNRNSGAKIRSETAYADIVVDNYNGSTQNNTAQNATQSHENRPAYYVLAFIMKL